MEGETSTVSIGLAVSDDTNAVNLEETFINLETKSGYYSQKIPLLQFLETVFGGKVNDETKLKAMSLLVPENLSSLVESESAKNAKSSSDVKKTSKSPESENESNKMKPEVKEVEKPKGRGRPRKVRVEVHAGDENSMDSCTSSTIVQQAKDKDTLLSSKVAAAPLLRRSSRVPTKNSKFKDDFVDSSIITSKGSASADTRLMTLALAAECHTTKPSKQSLSSAKSQLSLPEEDDSHVRSEINSTSMEQNEALATDEKRIENDAKIESSNDALTCQTVQSNAEQIHTLIDRVLKRTMQSQLNLCVAETKSELSEKPISQDLGTENIGKCSSFPHYYVITELKGKCNSDPFLIQRSNEGVQFRIADICGDVPKDQSNSTLSMCPISKYFKCVLCEKIFASASQWQSHSEQVHGTQSTSISKMPVALEKEIHSCNRCNQGFPFKFMLDNHIQKQEKCNTFSCQICNQKFSSQVEVDEHQTLSHFFQKCITCGECFRDDDVLRKHLTSCSGSGYSHDSDVSHKVLEMKEGSPSSVSMKTDNALTLTSQEEVVYKQREDSDMCETVESESMDRAGVKVGCELCGLKFSTYSGLWHHKLETHQEFFPPGLKEKLEARLEKTHQILSSVSSSSAAMPLENRTKSNYFVIMKPKWFCQKMQLKASMDAKKVNFSSLVSKSDDSVNEVLVCGQPTSLLNKGVLFHCNQCSIHYQTASDYREHRSKVHNDCFETLRYLGAFQCTYCSDTFPCEFMLHEHLKQHTGKRILPCTLCGLTFHKIQERRQHWKLAHPGVGCPNCGKMYASIKYLQKHISLNCQDHYPATKKFIAFRKRQHNDFFMEEKDKRVEKRLIKCHLCSKICSSVHGWRRHMSENHEDEGFSKLSNTCIICNEVIYGYKALEKHLLEVHAEDSGLPIEEENTIIKQAVENSGVSIQDYKKAGKSYTNIVQDEEGMFHCPECPKTHSDIKAINIHIKTHVNMQLECSICNKSFKNPTLLKQHVMRHRTTAVYNCETCGKKFLTLQKLNKHNKVHHSKESFVCELCGMSFALNDYLLKHKRSHTEKRPHSCSVCGKTFRTKPELRVHVLIHTQETPYVCEHCGRGFTQKGNWRIHLAQHTGVKPHKCDLCELSFALPSHLKRHLLTHNQKINYRCMWCDKECTQRKHMQMHVSRVHKEDFFQYEEQMKLDNPVPIAPSQMKIYNRRLGKAGQVRKPYRTRAKKCKSSIQDILDGVPVQVAEEAISDSSVDMKPMIVEANEETVTSDISIHGQDITADNMQILVSEDHQNYVKHDIPAGLIEEDGSNVEIVMGDNNEINIIINNAENSMGTDLTLQDGLDETGPVSLTHFTDASGQLPSSLQQAVNALVAGQKGEDGEVGDDTGLPLDMDAMIAGDNYTIVYPSGS